MKVEERHVVAANLKTITQMKECPIKIILFTKLNNPYKEILQTKLVYLPSLLPFRWLGLMALGVEVGGLLGPNNRELTREPE